MRMRTMVTVCVMWMAATVLAAPPGVGGRPGDLAAYVGGAGDQEFHAVLPLSDGTVLIGGGATDLAWLPSDAPRTELAGWNVAAKPSGRTAFILHVSADLSRVLRVLHLPRDAATAVRVLKTTAVPGQKTGDLYLSLDLADEAYVIARLDANAVDAPPAALQWTRRFRAEGEIKKNHPWDVGADGKVVYATGTPHGYDWLSVGRLAPDGKDDLVPNWRTHWFTTPEGKSSEHYGTLDTMPDPAAATHSGIVLKVWGRGDFRSWTPEDFLLKTPDGNGGVKQGRWPLDAMFPGPFIQNKAEGEKDPDLTGTGRGYYGYKWSSTPCANVSAIAIDRRTNQMFIGGNNKSVLPDRNPDFEPWLVAMSKDGDLQWWQRLYSEEKGVSTPDQYIDAVAVDYSTGSAARPGGGEFPGAVVVVARAHGNNVNNFWNGDAVKHPDNPGTAFQNGFTGTNGNIHYQWIGRLTLDTGTLLHATYFAEYADGAKHQNKPFSDPLLAHWPHFRAGWPDVNTTRIKPHGLWVDPAGRIAVVATGRRVITTSNAFQQMPSPTRDAGSIGQWADFVRVYAPDLTRLHYSSILSGTWDWSTGKGGSKVDLAAVAVAPDGALLVVGNAPPDKKTGQITGDPMPARNAPPWAAPQRDEGHTAVIARFTYE